MTYLKEALNLFFKVTLPVNGNEISVRLWLQIADCRLQIADCVVLDIFSSWHLNRFPTSPANATVLALKDVRANCLCASLLRTQFKSQRNATLHERASKGRNLFT